MKRMRVLISQRRMMVLVTLTVLVLAATALVASSASFTATSANPGNMFTAGILDMSNTPSTGFFTVDKMIPNQTASGTVTIQNTGDVAGNFYLAKAVSAETKSFGDKLDLTITGPGVNWTGKVNTAFASGRLSLGSIAPGAANARTYTFTVHFPDTGVDGTGIGNDNGYMGGTVTASFTWTAVTP
jgi:spore coat-associated protein N